uniref:Uncharacterized protein n=1 Tax=Anguilla anguilla TaxID=7936 RepID=A0A0E9XRA2_ANGAN
MRVRVACACHNQSFDCFFVLFFIFCPFHCSYITRAGVSSTRKSFFF